MKVKAGLDKYVTPHGFWDVFVTTSVLAVGIIVINWLRLSEVLGETAYFIALFVGLVNGQILVCVLELSNAKPQNRILWIVRYAFWPLSFVIFLLLGSRTIGFGYYSGLFMTFCFGSAVATLVKKLMKEKTRLKA